MWLHAYIIELARMNKKYKTDKLLPPTMDPSESPKQHALFGCPSHVLFLCDIRLTMPPALPEASLSTALPMALELLKVNKTAVPR